MSKSWLCQAACSAETGGQAQRCDHGIGARLSSLALVLCTVFVASAYSEARPSIRLAGNEIRTSVPLFQKFEVTFALEGSTASNPLWPYDPEPPTGVPAEAGITANGVFVDPEGKEYKQPGFLYQEFLDEIKGSREWHYPTENFSWKVRFSPSKVGTWYYKIVVQDRGGTSETQLTPFEVIRSSSKGFIRVSCEDTRYFEHDDGSCFAGLGFNLAPALDAPRLKGERQFRELNANGIDFVRMWISSLYGSAWTPYVGGRNRYGGYLPITGLIPFTDTETGETTLTMRIDYEPAGDKGWFDACRLGWSENPEAIKPMTNYRVSAKYWGRGIEGPRRTSGDYGFVIKFGGQSQNCYEPGTGRVLTNYGKDSSSWAIISGNWNSGQRAFLPRMYLALENVRRGAAYVREVSIREDFGDGTYGPEIMTRPSMEHQLYVPQETAFGLDEIVELAQKYKIYLKLVVMEKGDEIYIKMADDGGFAVKEDNQDGFYGMGRLVNKTRWLQQAWWRYLQARWGYSPYIHSWELTNEGDPVSVKHYELADEFGKFMHCRVFGVEPGEGDGKACTYDHPNDHLVTTSFWHSFPAEQFWANPKYPNVDYADLHAYVSTSYAPPAEKQKMPGDSASYRIWHSQNVARRNVGKPVVRGEAGLDLPGQQNERVLRLERDREGVWLHNFLWAGLDFGGLYELYWWNSHISNNRQDLRSEYRLVNSFLSDLDLNRGGYTDWQGTVSTPELRVVGQKNLKAGRLHLWIQNRQHTWKNVVENVPVPAVSGEVTIPGFEPGSSYAVEWWDTYATVKTLLLSEDVVADESGRLRLSVRSVNRDVALTIRGK